MGLSTEHYLYNTTVLWTSAVGRGPVDFVLRRDGLNRCLAHGEVRLRRWVGWGSLAANLVQMAQSLMARQAA